MRSLNKLNVIILVIVIVLSSLFFYKAGYIFPSPPDDTQPPDSTNTTTPPDEVPPPTSFFPSTRRDVSAEDEGEHFNRLRINREWWYYTALFTNADSDLKDWTVQISFNHMARTDLLGTNKPDLLLVTLSDPTGDVYGGIINKERKLGIINEGTLIANSPGVNLQFENSWAEGEYPDWHVHAEGTDVESAQDFKIDLDYHANALPLWVFGTRAFDESDSVLADYVFLGLSVNGTITIDGTTHHVSGVGHHEHAWSPTLLTRTSVNGWDWFYISLGNGWSIYEINYYPTPSSLSEQTSRINPFSVVLITSDKGETIAELRNVDLKITSEDTRVFPFVKMPAGFTIHAQPSINPLYAISQSLLYGTQFDLQLDITLTNVYNKVWKFPTYLGMKISRTTTTGTISWTTDDTEQSYPLEGIGVTWSMRALL